MADAKHYVITVFLMVFAFMSGVQFADKRQVCRDTRPAAIPMEGTLRSVEHAMPVPTPEILIASNLRTSRTLHEIGTSIKSDKVTVHRYDQAYRFHFERIRENKVKILEIGLGCLGLADVGLGIQLWGEYFKESELHVMELDGACGDAYLKNKHRKDYEPRGGFKLHIGDQSNVTFLKELGEKHGPWDIIIDDGSHIPEHQITTFGNLFPYITPGGVYSVEDVQTSFWNGKWGNEGTFINYMTAIYRQVHTRVKSVKTGAEEVDSKFKSPYKSVDCHHFVCLITKR
eukprot:TRINITY_DN5489_c0_g2_i1.p1 TRINITY_DN5489_c0_g2~~TRINITY_DN5489_c0_g2_i1.p1  ORF type:complete len:286 (+),score=49.85 TRINITY_DN5489_c0_g2_i1:77-934(+)